MTAYAYVRVSSSGQARDGTSLASQEAALRAYAELHDLTPVELVSDQALTTKVPFPQRPAGAYLLLRLRTGDHVLVTTLDRGWRNVRDLLDTLTRVEETGATLHVLDMPMPDLTSPLGKFTVTVFGAIAELERYRIVERTALGREQARAAGKWTAQAPFGFRHVEGKLRPVPRVIVLGAAILAMTDAKVPYVERLAWISTRFTTPREGLPLTYDRLRKLTDRVQRPADRARIAAALQDLGLVVLWRDAVSPGAVGGIVVRRRSDHSIVSIDTLAKEAQ